MKRTLFTVSLIFFYFLLNAQSSFKEGYIVSISQDTIHGTIKWQNDMQSSKRCFFKDGFGHVKVYHPGDIAAYRFENGKYFVTRFAKNNKEVKHIFAEYLVKGRKSLFYYRDEAGFHYLLSYKKDTLIEIPSGQGKTFARGDGVFEAPKLQSGFLRYYFSDQPSLYNDIDNIHELSFNDLISLTEKYNRLVCGNDCYTNYYKIPSIKLAFELQTGVEHFKWLTEHMFLPRFGGLVYLRLFRANKRIALKTGLLYCRYPGDNNYSYDAEFENYTIPFQFEYKLSNGHRLIPKFDLGVNTLFIHYSGFVNNYKILMLAGSAGALYKITKSVYFDASFNSDIIAFAIYDHSNRPEFFPIYSLNGGIYITL